MTKKVLALLLAAPVWAGEARAFANPDNGVKVIASFLKTHNRDERAFPFRFHNYSDLFRDNGELKYEDGPRDIVFVSGGFEYTVYYSGTVFPIKQPFLSLWVRPASDARNERTIVLRDEGLTGKLAYGSGWKSEKECRPIKDDDCAGYQALFQKAVTETLSMIFSLSPSSKR